MGHIIEEQRAKAAYCLIAECRDLPLEPLWRAEIIIVKMRDMSAPRMFTEPVTFSPDAPSRPGDAEVTDGRIIWYEPRGALLSIVEDD